MILDKLVNGEKYEKLIPGFASAIKEIAQLTSYKEGKYEISGGYYLIQKGTTSPVEKGCFETHKKYIDVQILIEGQEMLEWMPQDKLNVIQPYDEQRDVQFYQGTGKRLLIEPGMFYVMFPEDAHKACCHEQCPTNYLKIVLKIGTSR